jgi:hypothetical protein
MANNIGPIILGLGAAFLLMKSKDSKSSGGSTSDGGFGTSPPDGDSACHVLQGIWAQATPGTSSPLTKFTDNPNLTFLPLTPEAYEEAENYFIQWVEANTADAQNDSVNPAYAAAGVLTEGLGCPWSKGSDWTSRMTQVYNALEKLYFTNRIDYIEGKYKL